MRYRKSQMSNVIPTGLQTKTAEDDERTGKPHSGDLIGRQPFSREVLFTLGARLLMVASSFGAGIILARWLGAGGLGVYAALSVVSGTVVQMGGAGLTAANIYFIARDP